MLIRLFTVSPACLTEFAGTATVQLAIPTTSFPKRWINGGIDLLFLVETETEIKPKQIIKIKMAVNHFRLEKNLRIFQSSELVNKREDNLPAYLIYFLFIISMLFNDSPVPIATQSSGFLAIETGTLVASEITCGKFFNKAPPPVKTIP